MIGSLVDVQAPEYNSRLSFKFEKLSINNYYSNQATLTVTPDTIQGGDKVTLQWSNVTDPHGDDWIAIYCPKSNPDQSYLDFVYTGLAASTYMDGYGSIQVPVMSIRQESCEFRLFSSSATSNVLLATSNTLYMPDAVAQPTQVHLSLTSTGTEMNVMWTSGLSESPQVQWGARPMSMNHYAPGLPPTTYRSGQPQYERRLF